MKPDDIQRFPPVQVCLKDGTQAIIRPIATDDGEALARFYERVPMEDIRFYCPHRLDREHALTKAGNALSFLEVILVLEMTTKEIEGYAWYQWNDKNAERSTFGICLSRGSQGRGAGKALMERLLEIAQVVGPPVMGLTVQIANARAVTLYRQMGFTIIREQMRGKHLYGFDPEPEYYMERRVRVGGP